MDSTSRSRVVTTSYTYRREAKGSFHKSIVTPVSSPTKCGRKDCFGPESSARRVGAGSSLPRSPHMINPRVGVFQLFSHIGKLRVHRIKPAIDPIVFPVLGGQQCVR